MGKHSITPEIIDEFIVGFKTKLCNQKSVVTVESLDYGDTQGIVCVDNVRVGKIISYFSNMSLPDNVKLYFFPDYSFFDYCKMDSINQFLDYASQILKNTLITLDIIDNKTNIEPKKILDFRFDFALDISKHFYATFCSKETCFYETGYITYKLIVNENKLSFVDNFKYSINNHTDNIFAMHPFSNLLSVLLQKEDTRYSLSDDSLTNMVYQLTFNESEKLPNITLFADIVFYYTVMIDTNMELPSFNDYLINLSEYKKIVQMSTI